MNYERKQGHKPMRQLYNLMNDKLGIIFHVFRYCLAP